MNPVDSSQTTRFRENTVTGADARRQERITRSLTSVWNNRFSPREAPATPILHQVVTIGSVRRKNETSMRRASTSSMSLNSSSQNDSPKGSPRLQRAKGGIKDIGKTFTRGKSAVKGVFSNIFPKRQPLQNSFSTSPREFSEVDNTPKVVSRSLEDITSAIEETRVKISSVYDILATSITKYTLSVEEKKRRIATYIGAVGVIIKALVCHGDLKPENILWNDESFVINDFSGSISIEDMCELMNQDFRFENEEAKKAIRDVVHLFYSPNPKPIDVKKNLASIEKLVEWGILDTSVLDKKSCETKDIFDNKQLEKLKEYLATQFLPDGTEGYGSKQYRIAMCNYFWRVERENFKNCCHALDMRAAALTVYAILTGTHPPKDESNKTFYEKMEQELQTLGLTARSASIIRKMAEPCVPPLGRVFTLPVTLEELEVLKDEFNPKETPVSQMVDLDPQAKKEMQEDLKRLELLRSSLKRLSLSKDKGDKVPMPCNKPSKDDKVVQEEFRQEEQKINTALQNLQHAVSQEGISDDEQMTHELRIALVNEAVKMYYKERCEADIIFGGKTHRTVLLLDPSKPEECDVLLKKGITGSGGSATVYLALSLRTLKDVVIKYTQELADPNEANNADKRLKQIGDHEGIQERSKLFRLQRMEEYKQVVVEPFYKNRDFASCVFGDLFCTKWGIAKERDAVRKVLEDIDSRMQFLCLGQAEEREKFQQLDHFIDEYGKIFTAVLGFEETQALFKEYGGLIVSCPTLVKLQDAARRTLDRERQESLKIEAADLVKSCIKRNNDVDEDVVDKTSLLNLLAATTETDKKNAIKEEAKSVMQKLIRKCQTEVLRQFILDSVVLEEDPIPVMRNWGSAANQPAFRDKYLDLAGINAISRTIGIEKITLSEEEDSVLKEKLGKLCGLYKDLDSVKE